MKKNDLLEKLNKYVVDLKYDEKAKNSIAAYVRYAKVFINFIDHENDITKDDVIDFKDYLMNVLEYTSSSINSIIIYVNKFLHYCGLDDFKVKKIKTTVNSTVDEIMTKSDYRRLLRYAKKLGMNDMYMLMKTLSMTGIRCEELKFFTFEKVKKSMYIQVRNKGKTRDIIIRQDLRRELLKYCDENEISSGFIFRSPVDHKKMLHRTTIFRRLKRIAGAARVKKSLVYAHAFRHFFSITYLENGGNQLNLKDILGHSSLETTNIYTKRTREELRKQLESINFK